MDVPPSRRGDPPPKSVAGGRHVSWLVDRLALLAALPELRPQPTGLLARDLRRVRDLHTEPPRTRHGALALPLVQRLGQLLGRALALIAGAPALAGTPTPGRRGTTRPIGHVD